LCDTAHKHKQPEQIAAQKEKQIAVQKQDHRKMIDSQQCLKGESHKIVFDEGRERHSFSYDGLEFIFYLTGKQPYKAIASSTLEYGGAAFAPANLKKDDAVMLTRNENKFSQGLIKEIIKKLINEEVLNQVDYGTIIDYMKLRIQGLPLNQEYEEEIQVINTLNIVRKREILKEWFNTDFVGPSVITRALQYDDKLRPNTCKSMVCHPALGKMYREIDGLSKLDYNVKYVMIFDDDNYPFSERLARRMCYPSHIVTDYMAIYNSRDYIEPVPETKVDEMQILHDEYQVQIVKSEIENKHRLKLIYHQRELDQTVAVLREVIHSVHFADWLDDVSLDIHAGIKAQEQLQNMRQLEQKYERQSRSLAIRDMQLEDKQAEVQQKDAEIARLQNLLQSVSHQNQQQQLQLHALQ